MKDNNSPKKDKELKGNENESLDEAQSGESIQNLIQSYHFPTLMRYLDTISDNSEKIKLLIVMKSNYLQQDYVIDTGKVSFDKKCDVEIEKIRSIWELENSHGKSNFKSQFMLSNKIGAKIDLIRILNAMVDLHLVQKTNGDYPNKGEFMKICGEFFGTDLTNYHSNLSQALKEQSIEVNLKVFHKMIEITKSEHYTDQ